MKTKQIRPGFEVSYNYSDEQVTITLTGKYRSKYGSVFDIYLNEPEVMEEAQYIIEQMALEAGRIC